MIILTFLILPLEAVVQRCYEKPFNLIKKKALAQVFSRECCKVSKNTFFYRAPPVAASLTYDNTALTRRKRRFMLLSAQNVFLRHNLAHAFLDIFASKARVQNLYLPFGRDWNGWEYLTFCLENFVEDLTWEITWNN